MGAFVYNVRVLHALLVCNEGSVMRTLKIFAGSKDERRGDARVGRCRCRQSLQVCRPRNMRRHVREGGNCLRIPTVHVIFVHTSPPTILAGPPELARRQ
jgi:hypothetical protein